MIIEVNGVSLHVEDHGEGTPVLLIHGWPDSAHLWRHQIPRSCPNPLRRANPSTGTMHRLMDRYSEFFRQSR